MKGSLLVKKLGEIISESEMLDEDLDVIDILDFLAELGLDGAAELYLKGLQ